MVPGFGGARVGVIASERNKSHISPAPRALSVPTLPPPGSTSSSTVTFGCRPQAREALLAPWPRARRCPRGPPLLSLDASLGQMPPPALASPAAPALGPLPLCRLSAVSDPGSVWNHAHEPMPASPSSSRRHPPSKEGKKKSPYMFKKKHRSRAHPCPFSRRASTSARASEHATLTCRGLAPRRWTCVGDGPSPCRRGPTAHLLAPARPWPGQGGCPPRGSRSSEWPDLVVPSRVPASQS